MSDRCTITRADDGWTLDLRMRFDTLAGIQAVMDAADAAGWDGDVRVTIPKVEPQWGGTWQTGDVGPLVGGGWYEITNANGGGGWPIKGRWSRNDILPSWTRQGVYDCDNEPGDGDLLPPDRVTGANSMGATDE